MPRSNSPKTEILQSKQANPQATGQNENTPVQPPKKRKKRKNPDPTWSRRAELRKGKKAKPKNFSTAGLFYVMGVAKSPAKKVVVFSNHVTSPFKFESKNKDSQLVSVTPTKISQFPTLDNSPEKFENEEGAFRKTRTLRFGDNGKVSLYLPANKVEDMEITIPATPSAWLAQSPVPKVSLLPLMNVVLDKETILQSEKAKLERSNKGEPERVKTQNDLMNISAYEAMTKAGIQVEPNSVNWCHWKSHCHFDEAAQTPDNIALGTKEANAAMELVNGVLRRLVIRKNQPQTLYISYIPTWVVGYENIRLLKSLEMRISDEILPQRNSRKMSIKFNMLSTGKICVSEIEYVEQALMKEFDGHETRLTTEKATPKRRLNLEHLTLSPSKKSRL